MVILWILLLSVFARFMELVMHTWKFWRRESPMSTLLTSMNIDVSSCSVSYSCSLRSGNAWLRNKNLRKLPRQNQVTLFLAKHRCCSGFTPMEPVILLKRTLISKLEGSSKCWIQQCWRQNKGWKQNKGKHCHQPALIAGWTPTVLSQALVERASCILHFDL